MLPPVFQNQGAPFSDENIADLSSESSLDSHGNDFDGNIEDILHRLGEFENEENDDLNDFNLFCNDLFGDTILDEDGSRRFLSSNSHNLPFLPPEAATTPTESTNPATDDPFLALGDIYIEDEYGSRYRTYDYEQFRVKVDADYHFELKNIDSNKPIEYFLSYIKDDYLQQIARETDLNGYASNQ
eukprot:NODE_959_length_2884_cov_0.214363.p3 type:complete len:185 gc:universal NODE_959_length_2884_cov_0.214363:1876-2430(+)